MRASISLESDRRSSPPAKQRIPFHEAVAAQTTLNSVEQSLKQMQAILKMLLLVSRSPETNTCLLTCMETCKVY